MDKPVFQQFIEYVSFNILGMIGLSCYILADTFFVANALGTTGIAALNFSISIYSVIHGTGLMVGIGGAARYSVSVAQQDRKRANAVFSTSIKIGLILGVLFVLLGIFCSNFIVLALGADTSTLPMTRTYLITILCFAPFFIANNILLAFVRNDNNPRLSMLAMLIGSISNIILDYVFMFPFDMGMFGAAFATGLAPVISIGVLSIHFMKKNNNVRYIRFQLHRNIIKDIVLTGLSAFITEISSAVVLITFNWVILAQRGNLGVASYAIVANIALVGVSVFTGIAQGVQPLISQGFGRNNLTVVKKVMKYAVITSILIAAVMYLGIYFNSEKVIGFFNSEKSKEITQITKSGLRIYFIGFFFAGINIIMAMYLNVTEKVREAFLVSIMRGCIIIVPLVLILSSLLKMTGVWLSFVITEGFVTVLAITIIFNTVLRKGD